MTQATLPVFAGTSDEQVLAQRVFETLVGVGVAYARGALIRQTAEQVAEFLSSGDTTVSAQQVDAVVRQNPDVFAREERDDLVIVGTTKQGRSVERGPDTVHTFRQRLYEPERPLPTDDISNIVTLVKPVITVAEPVQISPYWRGNRTAIPEQPVASTEPTPVESAPTFVAPEPVAPTPAPAMAPVAPRETALPPSSIVLSDGTVVDLRLSMQELVEQHGNLLQAEIRAALDDDPLKRVVNFGDYFYAAEALPSFGKNDLRRIRDFIMEQGAPLTDTTIMSDLYRKRPDSPNFDLDRFALDYRLVREKDFEFVGVPGVNLWSAKGLPTFGTKRLKASDVGQLYSFLQEGYDDDDQAIEGMAQHTLTFFEWQYGILPLNSALASLFPPPLLSDQRTAVIRVESPQHYTTTLCELRFATGNRGGWLWGLEEFFETYLVPGASITLTATDDPTAFTIQYTEAPGTETKLLHLDEKRNRFAFVSVTYYTEVNEKLLPTQANYNKLRNLKPLPMNDRKKADMVLTHVFETVGEQLGSKEEPLYWIQFEELWMALNVLRPISHKYLEHLLANDDVFYADETTVGAYYYKPVPEEDAGDDDDSDGSVLQYDDEDD